MKLVQTSFITALLFCSTTAIAFDMPWDNDRRDRWRGDNRWGGDNRWDTGIDAFDDIWGDMFSDFDFEITFRASAEGGGRGKGRSKGRGRGKSHSKGQSRSRGEGRSDHRLRSYNRERYYGGNVYTRPYRPYGYPLVHPLPRPVRPAPAAVVPHRRTPPVPPPPKVKTDDRPSGISWKSDTKQSQ